VSGAGPKSRWAGRGRQARASTSVWKGGAPRRSVRVLTPALLALLRAHMLSSAAALHVQLKMARSQWNDMLTSGKFPGRVCLGVEHVSNAPSLTRSTSM